MSQVNLKGSSEQIDEKDVANNAVLKAFFKKSPQQIEDWIENNVNDLASAKIALSHLAKVVSVLSHKMFK